MNLLRLAGPSILILALWAALCAWVFIHSHKGYLLRWSLIPGGLVASVLCGWLAWSQFGYASPQSLPDEFDFLGYHIVVTDNRKSAIEVWTEGAHSRLYVVPYTPELEKTLKEAKTKQRSGGTVRMRKGAGIGIDRSAHGYDQPYESNLLLPENLNPKESQ